MLSYNCRISENASCCAYFIVFEYSDARINKYEFFPSLNFNCPNLLRKSGFLEAADINEAMLAFFGPQYHFQIVSREERKNMYEDRFDKYLLRNSIDEDFLKNVWMLDDVAIDYLSSFKNRENGMYDRWKLELFFKQKRLIPFRMAAIELSVRTFCLDDILDFLENDYAFFCRFPKAPKLIDRDKLRYLPSYIFPDKIYRTRNEYLENFHTMLNPLMGFTPEYCFIEKSIYHNNLFVDSLDIVVNRAVAFKYCIPIENKKPSYLNPDIISSYTNWICSEKTRSKLWDMINRTPIDYTNNMG